jgi:hypothetical protein
MTKRWQNQNPSRNSEEATDRKAACDRFAGELSNIFGKDWEKVQDQVDSGFRFLEHISVEAWREMVRVAVDTWEGWPRNWVKAVNEVYQLVKRDVSDNRDLQACTYCNGNGFFSGSKRIEMKPGVYMRYSFVWRCAACRNWYGALSEKIGQAYPLEIKSAGYQVEIYGKIDVSGNIIHRSIDGHLEKIGQRTNPKANRPDFLP